MISSHGFGPCIISTVDSSRPGLVSMVIHIVTFSRYAQPITLEETSSKIAFEESSRNFHLQDSRHCIRNFLARTNLLTTFHRDLSAPSHPSLRMNLATGLNNKPVTSFTYGKLNSFGMEKLQATLSHLGMTFNRGFQNVTSLCRRKTHVVNSFGGSTSCNNAAYQ